MGKTWKKTTLFAGCPNKNQSIEMTWKWGIWRLLIQVKAYDAAISWQRRSVLGSLLSKKTIMRCTPKWALWKNPTGLNHPNSGLVVPGFPQAPALFKATKSLWLDARSPHGARSPRPVLCQRDGPVPAASHTPGAWELGKTQENHESFPSSNLSCKSTEDNWNLGATSQVCGANALRFCALLCRLEPQE